MLTHKAFSQARLLWQALGSPWISEKLSCDMGIGFDKWNYIIWHIKMVFFPMFLLLKIELELGFLPIKICSFLRDRWRAINFLRTISNIK